MGASPRNPESPTLWEGAPPSFPTLLLGCYPGSGLPSLDLAPSSLKWEGDFPALLRESSEVPELLTQLHPVTAP